MSKVTILWSMNAAVCLTLAAMHLIIWLNRRKAWGHLLFSLAAAAAAVMAAFELRGMHATSIHEYGNLIRWAHVPFCVLIISIVWFARIYLQAGRLWLAWTVTGLRTFALIPNFLATYNLNYKEITGLRHIPFMGENVVIAEGSLNPWMFLGQLSSLLLLVFLIDVSITVWKRGQHRRALFLGGSLVFFILFAGVHIVLVQMNIVKSPYMISFSVFGIILVMAYELSRDVLRASQLAYELKESEERLVLAAEAASLGIWVSDLTRNEIWASEHWRNLFGFTSSERVVFENILQRMHPEDRDVFNQNFSKALAGEGRYETEYRLLLPDGKTRWISSRGRVEFNGGGKPQLLRGVSVDITARKQTEMEVLLQRSELTHLSRVTMLGELSGSMAHELNQPLTAILCNAQAALALLHQTPADINEACEALKDIVVEDKRAGEVIRRLRLLLTKGEVQRQSLNLNEIVQEVLKLVRVDLVSQGMTAHLELALNLPTIHADRVQLQQILLNLVLNACDAMANDPASNRQFIVRTELSSSDGVLISVIDHGAGIPIDNLEKVFDPFFTTKSKGMGLGLSVCRTIAAAHGGKLWALNNKDKGATLYFSLPLSNTVNA